MAKENRTGNRGRETSRGQGSTEYLVVLVVVLVIAVIVIALLGGFTPFDQSSVVEQSQTYWQGATPFSIEESMIVTENVTE